MPWPYRVWLQQTAFDFLENIEADERQRVLRWIRSLGTKPNHEGDYVERRDYRDCQITVVGKQEIAWWVDHAVCEVKVVEIRPSDS